MRSIVFTSTLVVLLCGAFGLARAVDCGDTITASVRLDHDLIECDGVGLVVAADGVTIDLAGHTIDGDEGAEDGIVTLVDRKNLTVKGPGVIRGFRGGLVVGGANLKVQNVTFAVLSDTAINVGPCPGSLVAGNVFMDVGGATDFGAGGGKVLVKGNVVARARVGIFVGDAVGASVVDNLVADVSASGGIFVSGANAVVKGNRVARTAEAGIALSNVTNGKVVANTVTAAGTIGIDFNETQTTRVERNVVTAAVGVGMNIDDDVSDGNRLRRNVVLGGLGMGVFVSVDADANAIEGNVVEGNALDGIRVEQAGTILGKNRSDGNGGVGITALPGAIDAGANRARGNGGAQCVGVTCP